MFSLTSRTCTKFSKIFLVCSVLLVMGIYGIGMLDKLFTATKNVAFVYYLSCLLSGLGLLFSIGTSSKWLKRLATFVHFSSIYGLVLFLISFIFVERFDFLVAIVAYLLLSLWLLKRTKQKWLVIACLGLPMLISTGIFIKLNYILILSGGRWWWDTLWYMFFLYISGLIGLILSLRLTNGKVKWILLGVNYFFAAYFHIFIFLH